MDTKPTNPTGVEAAVCDDIARRQQLGIQKYGGTVADNPLELREWLQHAYEECLDQAVYLKRAMAEIDRNRTGEDGLPVQRLVRLDDVIRIVSEHPEYPEPCPMLHEIAAKAAAEMDKEWVMHMVRETCRQTKEAILGDLKQSLHNAESIRAEIKP